MTITTSYTLDDLEVEIEGNPIPYSPGCQYLSNGEPGYPPDGGYVEDVSVYLTRKDAKTGKIIRLDITEFIGKQMGCIEQALMDAADDEMEAARQDWADRNEDR